MFIRSVKVPSSSGVVHEYVRVVESVRDNGRVKQRLVVNLGRRDTLMTLLPMLQRFLHGDTAPPLAHDGPMQALEASTWGPVLVVHHFFKQLGLWQLLDSCRRWSRLLPDEDPDDDWPSRALALIANRLVRPVSEHALAGYEAGAKHGRSAPALRGVDYAPAPDKKRSSTTHVVIRLRRREEHFQLGPCFVRIPN